jgi:hypothetical protein
MNARFKKGIFGGVMIASTVLVINGLHFLIGGSSALAMGPHSGHGPGGMGPQGGFDHHPLASSVQHGGGLPWVIFIIGLFAVVLLVRWLKKKSKTSSMQQFIDTTLVSSHLPVTNQTANALDHWEQTIITKKENN